MFRPGWLIYDISGSVCFLKMIPLEIPPSDVFVDGSENYLREREKSIFTANTTTSIHRWFSYTSLEPQSFSIKFMAKYLIVAKVNIIKIKRKVCSSSIFLCISKEKGKSEKLLRTVHGI